MSLRAMAAKELRQLSRDRRTLAVLLVLPALLLLFYGAILTFDVHHVSLAVLDRDQGPASRELVQALTSGEYFDEVRRVDADAEIDRILATNKATVVLVIPPSFTDDLAAGRAVAVQALIDATNATEAQTAQFYLDGYIASVGARLAVGHARAPVAPVAPRVRVLFNPDLASSKFLLPGLMGFILMISATIATALSVVRERETGTMEQLLVSPLSPADVVLGKALPYGAVSLLAGIVLLVTARFVFGMPIQGNPLLVLLVTLLFIVGAQGLGLLISSATDSQQVAFQAATMTTMLPTLLLSGFVFPIRSMPVALQAITWIIPARYFVRALRGVVLKGVGLEVIWPQVLALAAFAVLTLGGAIRRLRRARL